MPGQIPFCPNSWISVLCPTMAARIQVQVGHVPARINSSLDLWFRVWHPHSVSKISYIWSWDWSFWFQGTPSLCSWQVNRLQVRNSFSFLCSWFWLRPWCPVLPVHVQYLTRGDKRPPFLTVINLHLPLDNISFSFFLSSRWGPVQTGCDARDEAK